MENKKSFKVVIFDCDGVLFDSKKANEAYYNHILGCVEQRSMDEDEVNFVHMHTADESLAYLFRHKRNIQDKADAYRSKMSYTPFIEYMEPEPYLIEILQYLRPTYKIAISTNRTNTIGEVLSSKCLTEYFDLVVSAMDVPRPKPYPDSLYMILDHFKVGPKEVLYIGDSEVDQGAAQAAGVPLVAYKNRGLIASYHISHFQELQEMLERFESE
ncbi:MAG: HAD-IA family hydrolase [Pseudomonadota bacterium]